MNASANGTPIFLQWVSTFVRTWVWPADSPTAKKIAAIAEAYHSAVVTHNYLGPVLTAASVQLDTCIPNFVVQEYAMSDEYPHNAIYKTVLHREGGYIPVPEAPGIGVELNDDLLAQNPFEERDLTLRRLVNPQGVLYLGLDT